MAFAPDTSVEVGAGGSVKPDAMVALRVGAALKLAANGEAANVTVTVVVTAAGQSLLDVAAARAVEVFEALSLEIPPPYASANAPV